MSRPNTQFAQERDDAAPAEAPVHHLPIAWALHAAEIKARAVETCGAVLAMSTTASDLESKFSDDRAAAVQVLCGKVVSEAQRVTEQCNALAALIAGHRKRRARVL